MPADEFVSKTDCSKTMEPFKSDLTKILKALVDDDLRGGLVKDVADTKKDIAEIKRDMKNGNGHNSGLGKKEKAIVYSALITSVGSTSGIIIIEALKFFH